MPSQADATGFWSEDTGTPSEGVQTENHPNSTDPSVPRVCGQIWGLATPSKSTILTAN